MGESDMMVRFVQVALSSLADAARAAPMAAYMKTELPFYGVQKTARVPIGRELRDRFPPADRADYRRKVLSLWGLPHREEKYLAIGYAWTFQQHIVFDQIDLFERMIVEGAWWDFVDEIATHVVGKVLLEDRQRMRPVVERWIDDADMWLRRSAILSQNRHKGHTDRAMLFDFCLRQAHEKEFFIRKAIGWALREYARTEPEEVRAFLAEHRDRFSGLSLREAAKHL